MCLSVATCDAYYFMPEVSIGRYRIETFSVRYQFLLHPTSILYAQYQFSGNLGHFQKTTSYTANNGFPLYRFF